MTIADVPVHLPCGSVLAAIPPGVSRTASLIAIEVKGFHRRHLVRVDDPRQDLALLPRRRRQAIARSRCSAAVPAGSGRDRRGWYKATVSGAGIGPSTCGNGIHHHTVPQQLSAYAATCMAPFGHAAADITTLPWLACNAGCGGS